MRRSILMAVSATALAGAMAVGPFGAAAAAPYVYGCTPVTFFETGTETIARLTIYNGSASTATLILKILAGNGSILNPAGLWALVPLSYPLPPTHSAVFRWHSDPAGGEPDESNGTVATSVRIVSNVPVAATLQLQAVQLQGGIGFPAVNAWHVDPCAPMQP